MPRYTYLRAVTFVVLVCEQAIVGKGNRPLIVGAWGRERKRDREREVAPERERERAVVHSLDVSEIFAENPATEWGMLGVSVRYYGGASLLFSRPQSLGEGAAYGLVWEGTG